MPLLCVLILISHRSDANVAVSVMLREEVTSAFLAARVDRGGCSIAGAQGVYLWISTDGSWSITSDLGRATHGINALMCCNETA